MADSLSTQGVLNAADATVTLSVAGLGGVAFQVQGTFSGTITFEATIQGQDYAAFRVVPANSSTATSTTTTTGLWAGSCVGYLAVRARMSSFSSGAATVLIRADVASPGGSGGGGGVGSDVNVIEVGGSSIALGQAAMADSLPVVVASDQSAIDVNIVGGGGSGGTSSDFGDPFPSAGTAMGIADPDGTMQPLSAETFDLDTGAGTVAVTALAIALPGNGGPVVGGTSTNPIQVGDAGASLTVDGTVTANLGTLNGAATAANQQTDALTDAELRATPVPVSGTVSTGGLTDAELRASPVPVSGTVTANAGTNLNTSALALEATLSTLNGKVTACNTGAVTISAALPAGTNNIGDVDVATLPAIPAGTNLIGRVASSVEVGTLYQGTTSVTIGRAIIDAASSGDNTIVAAQGASNIIRVHSLFLVAAGTVTVRFESGAGGTALTGQMSLVANTGFVLPFNPVGWFQTAANTLLNLELSDAISVDGSLQYSVVT